MSEAPGRDGRAAHALGVVRRAGAEVSGVRLGGDLPGEVVAGIRLALLTHKVIFFRGQDHLDEQGQTAFARLLGEPTAAHPTVPSLDGNTHILDLDYTGGQKVDRWHTDVTFVDRPPAASVLRAFTKLVGQMRAANPDMRILVAKIIPMNPSTCAECGQRAVNFNNAVPAWAAATSTARSPIVVVDQWTGFDTATDTYDGVHPNAAGDRKMSDRWYPALTGLLDGAHPSPTPTVTPTPTATPTAPVGGCSATFRNTNQWAGGFQGEVTVRNTGTAAIRSWTVRWTFADGQRITQVWNGESSAGGSAVTVRNLSWNGSLAAGASTTFGFLASWNGVNTAPVPTCSAA
ncbi:cellulose binding domain-containing protein [Streptosporangium sandarakinum]|uniref:cellulose binding domain-containing protein n=1 Tax=Streptosporangium sandarakinum TaxID=1260955 RepID=UPI0037199923